VTGVVVDAGRILQIREERNCGIFEAKKTATIEALNKSIDEASDIEDIRAILRTLVTML
jgi:regulator of PEP synthase PpsR (kinase-PPPase family)